MLILIYQLLIENLSPQELGSACISFLRTSCWQWEAYSIYLNLDLHFFLLAKVGESIYNFLCISSRYTGYCHQRTSSRDLENNLASNEANLLMIAVRTVLHYTEYRIRVPVVMQAFRRACKHVGQTESKVYWTVVSCSLQSVNSRRLEAHAHG
jgi:hypothetical protein